MRLLDQFLFYDKIEYKALKSATNLRFIDLKFIDIRLT